MSKRLLLAIVALFVGQCWPAQAAEQRPNVILVVTDDQGYGDLSCHGNPVVSTPNLDRLHDQSVRLVDFHVAPMCTPSRGQLMTGVDALRNKAMNVSSGRSLLRRDLPTMADLFAASGYRTGIFGKWHLGDNYPYRPQDRGFQEAIWFPSSHISSVSDYWDNDYFDDTYLHGDQRTQYHGYCTDVFVGEAIKWMGARAEAKEPFFVYLPLNAPHAPHFVPNRYRAPVAAALKKALPKLPKMTDAQQHSLVSFLAMIENIDENIGALEKFLGETGLRENTLLIFLTDNGSTMGPTYYNAGMRGGKTTLWEGGHRVPCFLRWPQGALRPAGDVHELTEAQDILPTLVDLCHLQNPKQAKFDGVSLAGMLRGATDELADRMLVIHYSRMPWETKRPTPDNAAIPRHDGAAVLWKRWRLLNNKTLFNLDEDPEQKHNVLEQNPQVVAAMRAHYDTWWNGVKDQVNVPERVVIGHDNERSTLLSSCEWYDVIVDQQRQVRTGDERNSVWHLDVAVKGSYSFELRRWPREANLRLRAGAPKIQVTDGSFDKGAALPIAEARLRIGDETKQQVVTDDDFAVTFQLDLPAGPVDLQTYFCDKDGKELCGAYYVYVNRD